ncbi:MAG: hypothetical protein IIB45_08325 [Candidatus Marinimicrobia bacterium]|nr:hypothetical protein [Candidatus Neomarinimicrobiota bacterium]
MKQNFLPIDNIKPTVRDRLNEVTKEKSLSANTVFHFTESLDNLISILKNNFYPHFCLEDALHLFIKDNSHIEFAIPMVCFCDIPLSDILHHADIYGKYAIGLSKKWAIKNKVNPVLYTYPKSAISDTISEHLSILYNPRPNSKKLKSVLPLLQFIKPYEGDLWKNGKKIKKGVRFYDEREWRYVPSLEQLGTMWMGKNDYFDKDKRNKMNHLFVIDKKYNLTFNANDIKYIIVRNADEILETLDQINKLKRRNFSNEDVKLLSTKIISMVNIVDDF